jgi:hypothetical protein
MKLYVILGLFFLILATASIGVAKGTYINIKGKKINLKLISLIVYIAVVFFMYIKMPNAFYPTLVMYVILPSTLVGALLYLYDNNNEDNSKIDPNLDLKLVASNGSIVIKNIDAGVHILAGSGAGKTSCVVYPILKFFAETKRAGFIYDYKDGELTEIAIPLFKERLKIVSIHRPEISTRVNPIDPKYLKDEKNINSIVKVLLENLNAIDGGSGATGGNKFFYDGAESIMSATILAFKMSAPQYCTLPHVIAFLLAADFINSREEQTLNNQPIEPMAKLKRFLTMNKRVQIQASTFLLGINSQRQSASVLSTLASALRKIAYPDAFWALSKNEIDLDVNNPDVDVVISFVNEPKNAPAITPLLSCLIESTMKQMMGRFCKPSFIAEDEAATMKQGNLAETVSTMRSFGTSTIYCTQDISQGIVQYGDAGYRKITSNLSTQIFGKANDPKSAEFFEEYSEVKKEQTTSKTNSGNSLFGDGRQSTTRGEKEVAKIRKHEFMKFKTGTFAVFSAGKQKVMRFPKPNIEVSPLPNPTDNMRFNIELNYNKIIEEMIAYAEKL